MTPAGIMIPTASLEAPTRTDTPFPEGAFTGSIDQIRVRDFPEWVNARQGYQNEDGKILSIQLGSISGLEGQDDVGNRKHFVDFVIQDGDLTCDTVDMTESGPSAPWQLQRSTRLITLLAQALGATEALEFEGVEMTVVSETFVDDLQAGEYDGSPVAFVTYHRPWKKGDKSGTEVVTKEFLQAV